MRAPRPQKARSLSPRVWSRTPSDPVGFLAVIIGNGVSLKPSKNLKISRSSPPKSSPNQKIGQPPPRKNKKNKAVEQANPWREGDIADTEVKTKLNKAGLAQFSTKQVSGEIEYPKGKVLLAHSNNRWVWKTEGVVKT